MAAAACATAKIGRDFDPAVFQTFKVGQTTTADVLAAPGEPWLRQTMPDGSEVWTYMESRARAFSIPVPLYTHMATDGTTKTVTQVFLARTH
jgi:hypothetical protein